MGWIPPHSALGYGYQVLQYFTEPSAIGLQMAILADLRMAILVGYDSTCLQS